MRRYQNQRISARKATQKHGFRTEIQNELVRERTLTPPKLEFWQWLFPRAGRANVTPCEPARTGTLRKASGLYFSFDIVVRTADKFLHFRVRKTQKPLQILVEMIVEYAFSTRKLGKLRPFQSKKLDADALHASGPGQGRDFQKSMTLRL